MAFIDIHDLEAVSRLRPGQFALPTLPPPPPVPPPAGAAGEPLLGDTQRLRKTIKGICTTLRRRGLPHIADLITAIDDGTLPQQLSDLEAAFLDEMRRYLDARDPALLPGVFHKVHLWGGNEGRYIYVKSGGFDQNFCAAAYGRFALGAASDHPAREEVLETAADGIGQFGVSFATKHARFWAQAAAAAPLPIYDKTLAVGCLGLDNSYWRHYSGFILELNEHAAEAGVSIATLERHAFNSFSTPAGAAWLAARKP
ncbi:MAG TPA: hypothetical protein VD994_09900 [Prosthecobacter sp.]|nr:hypothetical protein [Prosthecobacter sp.]